MKARPAALLGALAAALLLPAALCAQGQFLANGPLPPVPVPPDNPQTDAKVRLGAQLYFDTRLSADNTISCATCHDPQTGWANHNPTDTGIRGQVGGRNSGTILDSAYMRVQFWDGRAASLEEQALGPIHNPIEMGETLENVVRKLNAIPGYRDAVPAPSSAPTSPPTASPRRSPPSSARVVSGPSPYDRWLAGEKAAMTPAAVRGLAPLQRQGPLHALPQRAGLLRPGLPQPRRRHGQAEPRPRPRGGHEGPARPRPLQDPGPAQLRADRTPTCTPARRRRCGRDRLLRPRRRCPNPNLDPLMLPLRLTAAREEGPGRVPRGADRDPAEHHAARRCPRTAPAQEGGVAMKIRPALPSCRARGRGRCSPCWPAPAGAVPVFARKYGLNCTNCHSAFPRLNDWGQRFRANGYRLPGRENEEKTVLERPGAGRPAHDLRLHERALRQHAPKARATSQASSW